MSSALGRIAQTAAAGAAIAILAGQSSAAQAACTWTVIPSADPGATYNLFGGVSADSSTDAWATGYYSISPSESGALAEHWNGSSWKTYPTKVASTVQTVLFAVKALARNNAWAVGYYQNSSNIIEPLAEHWNGTKWAIVTTPPAPQPLGGYLAAIDSVSPTDVWAVGSQDVSSSELITFAEHWNGLKWSVVTTPNVNAIDQNVNAVVAINSNDVWAGGFFVATSGAKQNFSMNWNGTKWKLVAMKQVGSSNNTINGMGALAANGVFAVGNRRNVSFGGPNTLSEGWDGLKWAVQPSPNDGSLTSAFEAVVASQSEGALAAGLANPTTGQQFQIPYAALWNGTKWVQSLPVAAGTFGSFFNSASTIPGTHNFWAAGAYYDQNGNFNSQTMIQMLQCP